MSIPPREYSMEVDRKKTHRFNENDIKSFVYHVFALYDRHPEDVNQFLAFLADHELEMRFPGEEPVSSHPQFQAWYAKIGEKIESNLHRVERINVSCLENGKYGVELMVLWQAQTRQGGFQETRFHQVWTLEDNSQSEWPRILRYVVEEVAGENIWKKYSDYLEKSVHERKYIDQWLALWINTGLFVVKYGQRPNGSPEEYGERHAVDLRNFMFGKTDLIKDIDVENSVIYQTTDPNVFFVTFEFKAETTNGHNYKNCIVAQVTLDQGKIKELIEYADPRPREIFLMALGV